MLPLTSTCNKTSLYYSYQEHYFVLFGAAKLSISLQTDKYDAPRSRCRLCTVGSGHISI